MHEKDRAKAILTQAEHRNDWCGNNIAQLHLQHLQNSLNPYNSLSSSYYTDRASSRCSGPHHVPPLQYFEA